MHRVVPGFVLVLFLCVQAGNAFAFGFKDVVEKAKELAASPYSAPPSIPKFMRELSYDAYQNIRFDPERSLWRENDSRFQAQFVSAGLYYGHPVSINVVDAEGVQRVPYRKHEFVFNDPELEKRVPADLGYAGLKLTYPFFTASEHNQFLVFAGASYFRSVGRRNAWGLSARGVAINTGLRSGEEFPSFVEFWLERPSPAAHAMKVYGLLDGKSVTGAYQFTAYPGDITRIQVEAVLFPRTDVELLGIAPLTSMFFHGENTARPLGAWRPEVHDSDGLLIHDGGSDEWLWRPLLNPQALKVDHFMTEDVRGFGLMQRDDQFSSYEDIGARYHERPSAWVEPRSEWGPGRIVLVQLPTPDETNDNVVAFWSPAEKPKANQPIPLSYTVSFGGPDVARPPLGQVANTFVGDGSVVGGGSAADAYRVIVDFAHGPLDKLKPRAPVVATVTSAEGTEVLEHFVEYNQAMGGWRLSILARPEADKPLTLRAFLRSNEDVTLTETWTYSLPSKNDIRRNGR